MSELSWNWLCAPYLVCSAALLAVGIVAASLRGDRVMRLGVLGAVAAALPWAVCSGLATCTHDPDVATRLLRLGIGPVALVGPNILLVLLGTSGQLERHRWVARLAGGFGAIMLALCWGTSWTVPGVHPIPSGVLYLAGGPLTGLQVSQLGIWLAIGMLLARGSTTGTERKRLVRMTISVLAVGAAGGADLLLVYNIVGWFPISWLSATVACGIALDLELRTDMLRPQGFDRGVFGELIGFAITIVVIGAVALALGGMASVAVAVAGSAIWALGLSITWEVLRRRPAPATGERALEQLVARLADLDDDPRIVATLAELWQRIAIEVHASWRADGDRLVLVTDPSRTWTLDREVAAWLVDRGEAIAASDLATIRLGALRPKLEAVVALHETALMIPLVDRGALVGLIEATHSRALREDERGLVAESARAGARALTYAAMARTAAREGATAREVEVAEAMRLQASASRDDELGRWTVAAEYRTAVRTTGAGWSAALLGDGRIAVLVTEAQAHGVPAAFATATLTGAFAAATSGSAPIGVDDLLTSLGATADGVVRGGERVAAFVAILDSAARSITWGCAGHGGAHVVGAVDRLHDDSPPELVTLAAGEPTEPPGIARGTAVWTPESTLVIASSAARGADDARWQTALREQAPAGSRLASVLVEAALRRGDATEDLLVVVVRERSLRRSDPVLAMP